MNKRSVPLPLAKQPWGRESATPQRVSNLPQTVKSAPIARIERAVHFRGTYNEEWREYLEVFARGNRHLAVKNLGGMACTYIESGELNAMLAARYPEMYRRPKDIRDLHTRFAKSFKTFVDNSLKARREYEHDSSHAEVAGRSFADMGLDVPRDGLQDIWATGPMTVRPNLRVAEEHSIVVDLSANPVLAAEAAGIRDYLRQDERLDLGYLKHQAIKPHVTIVRSGRKIQQLPLNYTGDLPEELTLAIPSVWREPVSTQGSEPMDLQQL